MGKKKETEQIILSKTGLPSLGRIPPIEEYQQRHHKSCCSTL